MPSRRNRRAGSRQPAKKVEFSVDIPMIGKGTYRSDKKGSKRSVQAPAARSTVRKQKAQRVLSKRNSEIVSGAGVLCEVRGSTDFATNQEIYAINPGLDAIFPWLSTQARGFSKYRIRRLAFHFRTSAPTSLAGNITLFGDANVTSPLPSSLTQAVSYQDAVTGPLWGNHSLSIPVKGIELYLRSGTVPDGQDPKTYDSYQFSWLVTGYIPSEVPISLGYIEMEYEVELIDRRVEIQTACECISYSTDTDLAHTVWQTLNADRLMGTQTFSLTTAGTGRYIGFPAGRWMMQIVQYCEAGSVDVASAPSFAPVGPDSFDSAGILNGDTAFDNEPQTFGLRTFAAPTVGGSFVPGVTNAMYLFEVQTSAGSFSTSTAGWFELSETQFALFATNTTITVTYMGANIDAPLTGTSPSPLSVTKRVPPHLAHLPRQRQYAASSSGTGRAEVTPHATGRPRSSA